MNISEIEKRFDKKFPYIDGNGAFGELDEVKSFLRSEVTALLESLKGEEVKFKNHTLLTDCKRMGYNQATQEFNERINKAKE